MKTTLFFVRLISLLLLTGVVSPFNLVAAQSEIYYAQASKPRHPYWQLKTDYGIRGTLVQFYDADSQLVYQESMPNQFIQLSPRKVRRLDRILIHLAGSQLIASHIRTSGLKLIYPKVNRTKAPDGAIPTLLYQ